MPDYYADLAAAPEALVADIAAGLERRALDPANRAILEAYLADIDFPEGAAVLEIGCGTGPVCRRLAEIGLVARVVGIEPSPLLVARAREIAGEHPKLRFAVGDGAALDLPDGEFDVVVLHTLLSHVPRQDDVLREARRVLKPGGLLAVCDADFSKISLGTGDADPLQACAEAFALNFVTDRWLVPRLPAMLAAHGFAVRDFRGYNRVDTEGLGQGTIWLARGADALAAAGRIGAELAEALKAEGRRRLAAGSFYATLPFASVIAVKG